EARGLNGSCLIAPDTSSLPTLAGLIWRVDLRPSGKAEPCVWRTHESMAHTPDTLPPPPQPGVNGVRYASKTKHLYYTSTGQKLFMRVRVDPQTHDPDGTPELVDNGMMADDFCIDE